MLDVREQLFVLKYINMDEDVNIGTLYIDVFGKEEGKDDLRTYVSKAKKLIKTPRCQEEIARLQAKDTVDVGDSGAVKDFVTRELLRLYSQSSTIIPVYDRNGQRLEGASTYMDSSVVKASMDMLGKSVGLFKDVMETKEEVINITVNGGEKVDG